MHRARMVAMASVLAGAMAPAAAQVRTMDPNQAIDQDLSTARTGATTRAQAARAQAARAQAARAQAARAQAADTAVDTDAPTADQADQPARAELQARSGAAYGASESRSVTSQSSEPASERRGDATRGADSTFHRDDLIGAGEGVFGKGTQGFAGIIEKILKGQGEPNAYIAGREASGAVVVGLRYGSGIMTHRVEGQMPVYWTGPSVGFDLGGDANKVFVLVYNLYDSAELYHRFPQAEGHLYAVGGFSASYLRWGHVVVIPVRLGVGWRAGVNVGYMKFSRKSKWLPF